MKPEDLTSIDSPGDFLCGTQAVAFTVISDKDTRYRWIRDELVRFSCLSCSRQQITRLVSQYRCWRSWTNVMGRPAAPP